MKTPHSLPKLILPIVAMLSIGAARSSNIGKLGKPGELEMIPIAGIANFLPVPLIDQGTDFSCGVSVLQSVLFYYDVDQDYLESELIEKMKVDEDTGVLVRQIKKFAQSQGFNVSVIRDMTLEQLQANIDAQRPVITLIQAWPDKPGPWRTMVDEGHYVLVNGYDSSNVYLMDPSTTGNYGFIPTQEFLDRWHLEDDEFGQNERIEHLAIIISRAIKPIYQSGQAVRVY